MIKEIKGMNSLLKVAKKTEKGEELTEKDQEKMENAIQNLFGGLNDEQLTSIADNPLFANILPKDQLTDILTQMKQAAEKNDDYVEEEDEEDEEDDEDWEDEDLE